MSLYNTTTNYIYYYIHLSFKTFNKVLIKSLYMYNFLQQNKQPDIMLLR